MHLLVPVLRKAVAKGVGHIRGRYGTSEAASSAKAAATFSRRASSRRKRQCRCRSGCDQNSREHAMILSTTSTTDSGASCSANSSPRDRAEEAVARVDELGGGEGAGIPLARDLR